MTTTTTTDKELMKPTWGTAVHFNLEMLPVHAARNRLPRARYVELVDVEDGGATVITYEYFVARPEGYEAYRKKVT
jgi:hypothetical protein